MVKAESFNKRVGTKRIGLYTLRNKNGLLAQITNYGAKIVSLTVPNDKGEQKDIVLGFNTLDEWMEKGTYFNAIIGRYANRIKDGRFSLDGITYQLPINNGTNSLHGGIHGWNEKIWEVVGQNAYSISLHYRCADGEEGYPGTVDVYVTYCLTRDNALQITFEAKTDKPTIIGLTNHAYFNLAGEGSGDVCDHTLQVFADEYTPLDETACPTGEIAKVDGTPMDFRTLQRVGDRITDPFFAPGRGIDNNFVIRGALPRNGELHQAAVVEADGRHMEVWTTMPGLQVYTGNWVEKNIGKSGHEYDVRYAICLEAQNFPDSPNHSNFPNAVLRPGEVYHEVTEYRFS